MSKSRWMMPAGLCVVTALAIAHPVQAVATFSYEVGGANAITVAIATTITVDIVVTIPTGEDIGHSASWSADYDGDGDPAVNLGPNTPVGAPVNKWAARGGLFDNPTAFDSPVGAGTVSPWGGGTASFIPLTESGSYGSFQIQIGGSGVVTQFFSPFDTIGIDASAGFAVIPLTINVPEPGTALLMLIGLAGLTRARTPLT